MKKIKSALVSVYNKENLTAVIRELDKLKIKIYSTGGTKDFIEKEVSGVTSVEETTSYPSILGGRVKTLHPKIFGGILARRDNENDTLQLDEYDIPEIDLVIVDLYPFEETVRAFSSPSFGGGQGEADAEIIEKIDIGGISLIRAAAKNFNDVLVVSSREQYMELLALLKEKGGFTELSDRKRYAAKAFNISSHYDSQIFNYFNKENLVEGFKQSFTQSKELRYGENPHQKGYFFGNLDEVFEQLGGKELSYNNLVDVDAAVNLATEFDEPAFVVIKHTNACGVATSKNLHEAWEKALAGDPVSAFGGIIATNRKVDARTAKAVSEIFFEVLIAPDFEKEALEILLSKKKRIILKQKKNLTFEKQFKSLLNGVIEQDFDNKTETKEDLKPATELQPTENQIRDLLFANKLAKHTKSNTIVLAKNNQLIGMGCGQTSRVDALNQAILKAQSFGFDLQGSVMASDAFFPFPDCVEIAHKAGIKSVIQPGGSIKDQESVDYCNKNGISMVFTGYRHFKH